MASGCAPVNQTVTSTAERVSANLPIEALEIIPSQRMVTDEAFELDLGRFFVTEACSLTVEPHGPLAVTWSNQSEGRLIVEAMAEGPALGWLTVTSTRVGGSETSQSDILFQIDVQRYHEFRFQPSGAVNSLFVAGDFNGWSASGDEMTDEDGDGVCTARLPLEPGRHLYKFVLNGDWIPDPNNPEQSSDGYSNSILNIEGEVIESNPQIVRRSAGTDANGREVLTFAVDAGEGGAPSTFIAALDNAVMSDADVETSERSLSIHLPLGTDADQVRVLGVNMMGDFFPEQLVVLENGRPVALDNPSNNLRSTVLYYAFVDRFANGNQANDDPIVGVEDLPDCANWNGGDLQGVLNRIEEGYFTDLGVTCIWLSPLNEQTDKAEEEYSPPNRTYSGYHGYWPVREDRIEPRFGDEALLHRVVDAAHERGIRVILDCVANHVHEDHPLFQEHRDWFGTVELPDGRMNIKLFDEYRLTTWFDIFLPSFDYPGAPEAIEHMTDNAVWWLQTFNLDGFRHDATKHIPDEFWTTLTRKIRLQYERPNGIHTYQVGETISGRDLVQHYATGGMLDGQFDFPLFWPTRDAFARRAVPMTDLDQALQDSLAYYGPSPIHSAIAGNHDVTRFMAYADDDIPDGLSWDDEREYGYLHHIEVEDEASYQRLAAAYAFLFTIPHVPMIYYGDEIGITGAQDPDNRRMMEWDDLTEGQITLRTAVSRLAKLRAEHPALWQGSFLPIASDEETMVYARVNFDEVIIVAFNRGDEAQEISVELPAILGVADGTELMALLDGGDALVGEGGVLDLTLAPRSARLLHVSRN